MWELTPPTPPGGAALCGFRHRNRWQIHDAAEDGGALNNRTNSSRITTYLLTVMAHAWMFIDRIAVGTATVFMVGHFAAATRYADISQVIAPL